MLYMGEGSKREQCCLLRSLPVFSHFLRYLQANWALLVLFPKWVGLCRFYEAVGLSNELSCEAGSFSCCCLNLPRCFQPEIWGVISPNWNPGLRGLFRSPVVPPGLSAHECETAQFAIRCLTESTSWGLAFPSPPPCLDEWFFVNSLVVGFPDSLIFCQFWLFFVFKFVIGLLLVVGGGSVCLPMPLSWLEVLILVILMSKEFY